MADIELVIKIDEEVKKAFDCAESNDLKSGYYDHDGIIGDAIKNGTPLPKGHDRLVEACAVAKALFNHKTIDDVPTIIEEEEE
jgi:hypothetical protein